MKKKIDKKMTTREDKENKNKIMKKENIFLLTDFYYL